jgi:ribosomal protein S18 acetylase RimI-like enzyme
MNSRSMRFLVISSSLLVVEFILTSGKGCTPFGHWACLFGYTFSMNIIQITTFSQGDQFYLNVLVRNIGWNEAQAIGQIQSIRHFLHDSNSIVIFARDSEKIAAFITCQFYIWNRLGQIHGLVVDPGYRRQSLASQLVKRVEQFLQQKGARGVYVDTPLNNDGGRRFYERIGYKAGYIMPEYYDAGQDGVTYQKFFTTSISSIHSGFPGGGGSS